MLEVAGLETAYGQSQVLFGMDLAIAAGQVVTLMGRNGMGKTTTVRSIMGLTKGHAGSIRFEGTEIRGLPSYRVAKMGLGLVPEGRQIFPNLSVRENLVATADNRSPGAARWTLESVLAAFPRLSERAGNMGNQLSGGEQQMLAVARALMTNPRLLILDEATEGLAPLIRKEIWQVIRLIKASGIFLSESLRQVKPSANPEAKPGEQFPLGNLNADKTKPLSVHNYPANTDLVVEYVYDNPQPVRKQQNTFAIGETWVQERPRLPAPHQVAVELWKTTVEKKSTSISNKHEKQSQYSKSSRAFIGNYIYTASNQNAYNNNLLTINIETGESTKEKLPAIKGEKSNRWIYHSESHNGQLYISSPLNVDGKMGIGYHKLENGKIAESKFIPLGTDLYPHFTYKLKSSKNGIQAYGSLKEKKFSKEHLALFYHSNGKTTIINKGDISASSGDILSKGNVGFDFREPIMNNGKTFIVLDAFRIVSIPEGGTRNNYKMTILLACDDAGKVEWETTHTTRDDFEGTNLRQNLFYGSIIEISSSKLKVIYVGKDDLNIGVLGFDKSMDKETMALDEISNAFNLEATESLINYIGDFRHILVLCLYNVLFSPSHSKIEFRNSFLISFEKF